MTTYCDGKPILYAAQPPAGARCAGCKVELDPRLPAVTRDGKAWYHNAANGGCESSSKGA
jgi:hypothetical protein